MSEDARAITKALEDQIRGVEALTLATHKLAEGVTKAINDNAKAVEELTRTFVYWNELNAARVDVNKPDRVQSVPPTIKKNVQPHTKKQGEN